MNGKGNGDGGGESGSFVFAPISFVVRLDSIRLRVSLSPFSTHHTTFSLYIPKM